MRKTIVVFLQIILLVNQSQNIFGFANMHVQCAVRREISPCTCQIPLFNGEIKIVCERVANFTQIVNALQNRFEPGNDIGLEISHSTLEDFEGQSFGKLGLKVKKLYIKFNSIKDLPESTFEGLSSVEYLDFSNNKLKSIPTNVLQKMPLATTVTFSGGLIENVTKESFQGLPKMKSLLIAENMISRLDEESFPRSIHHLHIGHNRITDLNGTLRSLENLEWLFLNDNLLTDLDKQLPAEKLNTKLKSLIVDHNQLKKLPKEMLNLQNLDYFEASWNQLETLDGVLSKARKLKILTLFSNKIKMLNEDEFTGAELLDTINLGDNMIHSLNSSLLPLRNLKELNLTQNNLTEFSLQDIKGLQQLEKIDLSYNKISRLTGRIKNSIDSETKIKELYLNHNELETLSGSLMGITGLQQLNLSHNLIHTILPDDLIGLDELVTLDISHNRLTTLEETSKTFLPSLKELSASHNQLTALEKDFHGLPNLCNAVLTHNKIASISKELTAKTQCKWRGVNRTLWIYMDENPVICDEKFPEIKLALQSKNNTEIIFETAQCAPKIVPIQLIPDPKTEYEVLAVPQPLIATPAETP